jgi:HK97 family phage major capsid protein
MSTQLREQRAVAHNHALDALRSNNQVSFDKAMLDVDRLTKEIETEERRVSTEKEIIPDLGHKRAFAFSKWVRRGEKAVSEAEMRSLRFADLTQEQRDVAEGNVLNHIGTYTGLGYLVPTGFAGRIEQAMKYFAPLMNEFGTLPTSSGNPLPFPTSDDTSNAAVLVSEAGVIGESDVTANQVTFGAYKFTSGVIKASVELLEDSGIDIDQWLADRFAERYGRAWEYFLTQGEGSTSGEPMGLLTYVAENPNPNGVVIATGSSESTGGSQTGTNSVGYSDLVNLEHSVDPAYRRGAKYMFHDLTLSAIKRIIDKFGRPLWVPGISVGEASTINGYPYIINQSMPQIAASNVTVAFGDFSKMLVRKVSGFSVQRLAELYAATGQIGFISHARMDCNGIVPSGRALNVLMQHS